MMRFRDPVAPRRFPLLACLLLALPVGVTAQDPLGAPLRDRAEELRDRAEELRTRVHGMVQSRARIGVALGATRNVGGRTGVVVNQAVEGGPAARAGIRAGDVILALDGQLLGAEPGSRLVELVGAAEPGDTVTVLLHRDGRDQTVRVVTDRTPATVRFGERGVPGVLRPGFDAGPVIAEALSRRLPEALGPVGRHRLVLVEMNPGLGRYFDVTEGVLVANIAEGSSLGLQPGDVLVSIGGRAVRDAAHARSILGSYRADEDVEMRVVRDRRTITIRGTAGTGSRP